VNGLAGDDRFFADDNSSITTLDGGTGDDFFQFGQMFGIDRDTANDSVAPGDEIDTVQTTRGFLSRGISFPATVYGGEGDDKFVVYSNKALLKMFGEEGNDEFTVRAFIIVSDSSVATGDTVLAGGGGDDRIEYNINAPVSIDGGAGSDTVVVIGTEADDNFVIRADGVQGAGLNIDFNAVEKVEVDGMEGNDHFFVLSTSPKVITTVIGGLGSDTFDVGGDVTEDIVAMSVEGRSGFINHNVTSADPAFDNIMAEGVQLNVADAATGTVIVSEDGGETHVVEDGAGGSNVDTYRVRLAVPAPADRSTVAYMTVSAALASYKDASAGGKSVEVSTDGVHYTSALVLTFDASQSGADAFAWDREQTIYVRAASDAAVEGDRTVIISHSIESDNPAFDRLNIANVEVKVVDNEDRKSTRLNSSHRLTSRMPSSA
jgi:hypothetical protein